MDHRDKLFGLIFLTEMAGIDPAMLLPLGTRNALLNFGIEMT